MFCYTYFFYFGMRVDLAVYWSFDLLSMQASVLIPWHPFYPLYQV